jgi:excisionase family DNA binding protein
MRGNGLYNEGICMSQWLTAREAAEHLKAKPRTILSWAKAGKIPAHRLSGSRRVTWRFCRAELDAMLSLPSAALNLEESNAAK